MDVFVYGTLTEPERVAEVLDSYVYVGPATLFGLHLVEDGTRRSRRAVRRAGGSSGPRSWTPSTSTSVSRRDCTDK